MKKQLLRLVALAATAIFVALSSASLTMAQAWVPAKGQASIGIYYEFTNVGDHLFSADVIDSTGNYGKQLDLGDIKAHSVHLNLEYGLTNRLALSTSVPEVVSRYKGSFAESPTLDDGLYRGGIQDFQFAARYMAVTKPVVLTPFLSVVIPSHNYPTLGHTAIGRNLTELHGGFYVGKLLSFVSDNLYTQAGYDFAYVEKADGIRANRTNLDLNLGYFVTRAVSVGTSLSYQNTHGGMDWLTDITDEATFHNHDRHAAADWLHLGGSLSVDVTDALKVFAAYTGTLWGENTHEIQSIAIGTSWSLPVFR